MDIKKMIKMEEDFQCFDEMPGILFNCHLSPSSGSKLSGRSFNGVNEEILVKTEPLSPGDAQPEANKVFLQWNADKGETKMKNLNVTHENNSGITIGSSLSLRDCYQCDQCDLICTTHQDMKNHLETSHPIDQLEFVCAYCGFTTHWKNYLKQHIDSEHNLRTFIYPHSDHAYSNNSPIHSAHNNLKTFKCPHCDYACSEMSILKEHIDSDHNNLLTIFEQSLQQSHIFSQQFYPLCDHAYSLKTHIDAVSYNFRPLKCPHCDHAFSSKLPLKKHIRLVHSLRSFACPHCNYESSKKSYLNIHIDSVHNNLRPLKCPHCDYATSSKSVLKKHIDSVHYNLRPYKCPHCDHATCRKACLKKHIDSVHKNIRSFKCPHCDLATSSKSNLKSHIDIVHNSLRPFQCPHCDYSSVNKSLIKIHIDSVHINLRPFKCPHCDNAYSRKHNLKAHIDSVHINLRPFKCLHCGHSYATKSNLKIHIYTSHTDLVQLNAPNETMHLKQNDFKK